MDITPVILTVHEFASLINVNVRWLYRAIQSGLVPCIRIGRSVRIDRDAALAHLSVPAVSEER
jgi:excisionase family DNA binding protein